jgi:hypothetical protein
MIIITTYYEPGCIINSDDCMRNNGFTGKLEEFIYWCTLVLDKNRVVKVIKKNISKEHL